MRGTRLQPLAAVGRLSAGGLLRWYATLVVCFSIAPPSQASDDFTVQAVSGLPDELSEGMKSVLNPEGYRVRQGETEIADFWLRLELPLEGQSEGVFGIELGAVTASGLVGAVRFHDAWIDYRETELDPGVYTLRYWIQPADGDHMGVSEYRDFLLVCPPDIDSDPDQLFEQQALLELSQEASQRVHPAVIAVFPIWDDIEGPFAMVRNEIDQWTLVVPVGDRTVGVVVEGYGELP